MNGLSTLAGIQYPAQIIPDIYYCTTTKLMVKSSQSCIFAAQSQSRRWYITELDLLYLVLWSPAWCGYCIVVFSHFLQLLSSTSRLSHLFYEQFLAQVIQNDCPKKQQEQPFLILYSCILIYALISQDDGIGLGLIVALEHY